MLKYSMRLVAFIILVIAVNCSTNIGKPGTGGTGSPGTIEKTDHQPYPDGVSCYVCHKADIPDHEFHRKYGNQCDECHEKTTWMATKYPHPEWHLNKIHNVRCTRCHTKLNEYNFTYYQCYGCHHEQEAIEKTHENLNARDLSNCVNCHKSTSGE